MGRSSGDGCSNSPAPWDCASSLQSTGGPRAGDTCGGSSGSPRFVRIFRIGPGSVMKLISRISPPQLGHVSGNSSPTRASSFAQAIRDVSWWQGFVSMVPAEPQQPLPAASETPSCSTAFASRCLPIFPTASAVTACRQHSHCGAARRGHADNYRNMPHSTEQKGSSEARRFGAGEWPCVPSCGRHCRTKHFSLSHELQRCPSPPAACVARRRAGTPCRFRKR